MQRATISTNTTCSDYIVVITMHVWLGGCDMQVHKSQI